MGAWYRDSKKTVYVGVYKNEKDMKKEVEQAGQRGWVPQMSTQGNDKTNRGRTAARGLFTGGIGLLLFGRSRKHGKLTVTYTRSA
jgi:hypothetical protein